jgi:hypothetical protein
LAWTIPIRTWQLLLKSLLYHSVFRLTNPLSEPKPDQRLSCGSSPLQGSTHLARQLTDFPKAIGY